MKKLFCVLMAVTILSMNATTALAGTHHSKAKTVTAKKYSVCTLEDCTRTGQHAHKGITYTAHYYGDGHDYHEYCNVNNCTLTGYHEHNGEYCFGYRANGRNCCR